MYKEIIYLCEARAVVVGSATQSEALAQLFAGVVTLLQAAVAAAAAGEEASLGTERRIHTACQRVAANSKISNQILFRNNNKNTCTSAIKTKQKSIVTFLIAR